MTSAVSVEHPHRPHKPSDVAPLNFKSSTALRLLCRTTSCLKSSDDMFKVPEDCGTKTSGIAWACVKGKQRRSRSLKHPYTGTPLPLSPETLSAQLLPEAALRDHCLLQQLALQTEDLEEGRAGMLTARLRESVAVVMRGGQQWRWQKDSS